jgi:predicted nucleic acid-binding protein
MINSPIIADTGVIVGLIYEKDQWHEWVFEQSKREPGQRNFFELV